jgi:hypothetical protein
MRAAAPWFVAFSDLPRALFLPLATARAARNRG